ncbi:hypothetical protein A2118_02280 [Candidatus Kaiserbacteria bacterium GWA2_50_9]|uniref:Uncharacterized protein n=1 Tax=Candidatus Kaiserbacteria bacterium GWA2_50_9 TaxID=1798474 RepID=A0A1F6BTM7_9BACT|nr:MAG: hypothetical protein A2118_02280 [Candidatus Kaiserbacteria bacterium GWA2_50_9]
MVPKLMEFRNCGPTLTDTIFADKLARFMKENPDVAEWACRKFETAQGRKELEALMHVALLPRD